MPADWEKLVASVRSSLEPTDLARFDKDVSALETEIVFLVQESLTADDASSLLSTAQGRAAALKRLVESWWVSLNLAVSPSWQADVAATEARLEAGVQDTLGIEELRALLHR